MNCVKEYEYRFYSAICVAAVYSAVEPEPQVRF